jgi:hypothetical protein
LSLNARAARLAAALGQKQTYALQQAMSAESGFSQTAMSALPRKRTCAVQLGMSALGQ